MNLKRSSLLTLAVAAAFACNGKLKVGSETPYSPAALAGESGEGNEVTAGTGTGGSPLGTGGRGGSAAGAGGGPTAGAGGIAAGTGGVATAGTGGAVGTAGSGGGSAGASIGGGAGAGGTGGAAGGFPCPDFQTFCGTAGATDAEDEYWDSLPRTPPTPSSDEGCPEGPQTPDGDCEEELGLVCAYFYEDEGAVFYEECACAQAVGGGAAWRCELGGGSPIGSDNPCPPERPTDRLDCFGSFGLHCPYPWKVECSCTEEDGWLCMEPFGTPDSIPRPTLPDPDKPITELSDEERELFCDWSSTMLAGGEGHLPTEDSPIDEDGYVTNVGCAFGDYALCPASLPVLSKAQCIGNLAVSDCEGPVGTLAECVRNVFAECTPETPACVQHLGTPNCAGTGVGHGISMSACHLRVE